MVLSQVEGTLRDVLVARWLLSTLQWLGFPLRHAPRQLNREDSSILLSENPARVEAEENSIKP
jgi:hypothetical protein